MDLIILNVYLSITGINISSLKYQLFITYKRIFYRSWLCLAVSMNKKHVLTCIFLFICFIYTSNRLLYHSSVSASKAVIPALLQNYM